MHQASCLFLNTSSLSSLLLAMALLSSHFCPSKIFKVPEQTGNLRIIWKEDFSDVLRFVMSLSCADLCHAVFVMIPYIITPGGWWLGITLCKAWVTADMLFCTVSIYCLIGISIDRFHAIYRPISYNSGNSNCTTNMMVISVWLISIIISLPRHVDKPGFSNWYKTLSNRTQGENVQVFKCIPPFDSNSAGYNFFLSFFVFILPFGVLIIFYLAIAVKMRSRTRKRIKNIKKAVAVWATPSSKCPIESAAHLKVPGQNLAPDSKIAEDKGSEKEVEDDYGRSGVYLGNEEAISKVASERLRKEESFQRRYVTY